jgi:acetyltransferase EpsM
LKDRTEHIRLILLGAGNFAEEIADVATDCPGVEVVAFVEGIDREKCGTPRRGIPVWWIDDLADRDLSGCAAVCAVGTTKREGFIAQGAAHGLRFTTVVHPSADISGTVSLGEGTIIGKRAVIGAHASLGRHVIVNRGALIGHHVDVEDYTTISPGANIASSVRIGRRAYVGMGACIVDQMRVGERSVIGAGAVVTKDVPDRVLTVGVPARIAREGIEGF